MRPRFLLTPFLCGILVLPVWADEKADSSKEPLVKVPSSVKELKDLEHRVQEVYKKVTPAVVGIQIGGASGSGVIISEDGYVLTAGHVSGKPDTTCTIIMPDGKRLKGKSLGQNIGIDSGLIKITEEGKWPHVEMGESKDLAKGQWVVSLGHPNGYINGRTPVLRLGRIQNARDSMITTDCTLVGGDSGGPLFDLEGKVIGIHSRIGPSISFNVHVPVSTYRDTWDRLVAGESWGGFQGFRPTLPAKTLDLGARYELAGGVLRVTSVEPGSMAEKAGLKARDLIKKFDGQAVSNVDDIKKIIAKKKNGDKLTIEIDRGADTKQLTVELKS